MSNTKLHDIAMSAMLLWWRGVLLLNTKNMIHKVLMKLTSVNMMHNILSQDLTIITPALPQAATDA